MSATVDFSTSPINGGSDYALTDLSTNTGLATGKRVVIRSGIDNSVLSDTGSIAVSINPVVLDASAWPVLSRLMVIVELSYFEPNSLGNSVQKGYLAPLTLNIPS